MEGIPDPGILAEPCDLLAYHHADLVEPLRRIAELPDPGQGTFFDEYVDLRDPEGGRLTDRLVEFYDKVRPKKRKRGRDTLKLRLRKIAANALRGHYFRHPPAVLYFAKADAEEYVDKPSWMKHGAISDAVTALVEAGLVERIRGKKMPWNSETASWASSYWATDELISMAMECGVSAESIDRRIPADELVQLYAPKPRAEYDRLKGGLVQPRKGKRIWFEPTEETLEWIATLEGINAFYRQQEIALGLAPADLEGWLAKRNADPDRKGSNYRLPEMFSTDIYRVFNNGDEAHPTFDEGGRLFGGWWMHLTEDLRKAITINGKPAVELDYASCHPWMLYHQRHRTVEGDLYILPEITKYEAEKGEEIGAYRPCVKWLTQVLINGRGRLEAVERPKGVVFPTGISNTELAGFIEARHQQISDAFGTGAGLGLMRTESDIALEIVTTAMTEGWTALSVHDSFITTTDQRDRLKALMIDVYTRQVGMEPMIKECGQGEIGREISQ